MAGRLCLGVSMLLVALLARVALGQTYVGQNFTGSSSLFTIPPDSMGAVGQDYFVELNNVGLHVYRKNDGVLVSSSGLSSFWSAAGASPSGTCVDPRILYDPHARRWYAAGIDNAGGANSYLFAVSSTSNPLDPWNGFNIDSDSFDDHSADFPMIGYTGEAVYLSAVMPPTSAASTLTSFVVMPKYQLLLPSPNITYMTKFEDEPQTTAGVVPQLAVDADNRIGYGLPVVSMNSASGGTIQVSEIGTAGSPSIYPINSISAPAAQPPTVDQPGPAQNIEANDWRFSANSVVKNGTVYAVQSVEDSGRAAVRFLRIDSASGAVLQNQVIADPTLALTFPSIAVNDYGEVVIGVTGTSTTEYASSYAIVGDASVGGSVQFNSPPMLLKAGVDSYVQTDSQGRNRWGDYSATTVDPADPSIFWTTQEYVSNTNHWSTQVSEVIVSQPTEARWADAASGQFDDPVNWHAPNGVSPQAPDDLVFSRATDPGAGPITVTMPPAPVGTYTYQSASFRQGDVVLDLGGNDLDLALELNVGPYHGDPQVTITNGNISSDLGFIAAGTTTSQGSLMLDAAHWTARVDLQVGSDPDPFAGGLLPGSTGGIGTLTIDNNSQLDVGGQLVIKPSSMVNLLSGVLTVDNFEIPHPLAFNFAGGTLHADNVTGDLDNYGGTVAPGRLTQIGATNVSSAYFQHSGGSLAIEIGGTGPADYDRLTAATAQLDGLLAVSLVGGFVPSLSDVFDIVTGGGALGAFATTSTPVLGSHLDWHVFYVGGDVSLAVVPIQTGDYNADGIVDAADYTVWRDTFGVSGIGLAADSNFDGVIDNVDYLAWKLNFGAIAPGAGSGALAGGTVPEPATWLMLLVGALLIPAGRRARRRARGQ